MNLNNIIRNVLSIMSGTFVALVLMVLVQAVARMLYPPAPGLDYTDPEVRAGLMMTAPLGALLMVLLSYAVAAMAGAFMGARFSAPDGPIRQGLFVTVLILIMGFMNLNAIPHPLWFWVGCIVVIIGAGYFGADRGSRRKVK